MGKTKIRLQSNIKIPDDLLSRLGLSQKKIAKDGFANIDLRDVQIEDLVALKQYEFVGDNADRLLNRTLADYDKINNIDLNKTPTQADINNFKGATSEAKILFLKNINLRIINDTPIELQNLGKIIVKADLVNGRKFLEATGLAAEEAAEIYKKLQKAGESIYKRLAKKIGLLDEAGNADLARSMKLVVAGGVVTAVGYLVYFVIANAGKIPEAIRDVLVSLGESAGDAAAFAAETAADVASGGLDTFFKGLSLPLLIGGIVFFVFFMMMMMMMR